MCMADLYITVAAVLQCDHYRDLTVGHGRKVVCEGGGVFQVVLHQVVGGVGGRQRTGRGLLEVGGGGADIIHNYLCKYRSWHGKW